MTVTPYKTICSAFGCKRYTRRLGKHGVYLCPGHWQPISSRLRKLANKAYRIAERNPTERNLFRARRLWARCVDKANINQFGI